MLLNQLHTKAPGTQFTSWAQVVAVALPRERASELPTKQNYPGQIGSVELPSVASDYGSGGYAQIAAEDHFMPSLPS